MVNKPRRAWRDFFEALDGAEAPADFLDAAERDQGAQDRDPFAEEAE
jgi:antitoxin VapB